MPRKKEELSEGPTGRAPRGLVLAISPANQKLMRELRARTNMTLSDLTARLEASPKVAAAIKDELRSAWNRWLEQHGKDDPFAEKEEGSRG
jgi:hypothetical protein